MPNIEILLATFNGEDYLPELLASLARQTVTDWNLLVSDDGSSDNTKELLNLFQSDFPDRVKILHYHKHFDSARDNFFFLLKNSSGRHLFFCDQDDYWLPSKLELFMNEFVRLAACSVNQVNPILIHSDLRLVDARLNTISHSMNLNQGMAKIACNRWTILGFNPVTGCSLAINRTLADSIVFKDDAIMHDWFIALSAFYSKSLISYIKTPLVLYRQHSNNVCGARNGILAILRRNLLSPRRYFSNATKAWNQARHFCAMPFVLYLALKVLLDSFYLMSASLLSILQRSGMIKYG